MMRPNRSASLMTQPPGPLLPLMEVATWLWQHIPFRVTAAIAGTTIETEWASSEGPITLPLGVRFVCFNDAVYQGRISAARWLIEFVGLQEVAKKGIGPTPSESRAAKAHERGGPTTEFGIGMLPGGTFLRPDHPDAAFLARTWKGCAQAISHPTRDTDHPRVDPETLTRALRVILPHLDRTIYAHARLSLRQVIDDQVLRFAPDPGRFQQRMQAWALTRN